MLSWFESKSPSNPSPRLRSCFANMYYVYILHSSKSSNFYFGSTSDVKTRFTQHNKGLTKATAPYTPGKLVWYAGFQSRKLAEDFERYFKTGSGKAFAYKRLLNSEALKKDKLRL